MKRLLLVTLLAACAQRVENIGNTLSLPPDGQPPEPHAIRWAATFGTDGMNESRAVAVAPGGDVIAAISLSGLHDFGGGNGPELAPDVTALVTRRAAADGHEIWTKTYDAGGFARVDQVAVDRDGAVIVAGGYVGTLQLGTTTLDSAPTAGETFVVKYDSDGTLAWVQRTGAPLAPRALAVDADGNVFLGAWLYPGTFTFLGETYTAVDTDAAILSYASDGTPRWGRVIAPPEVDASIDALAVGPSGEVAFAGSSRRNVNGVVGMLANDGSHLWSAMIGPNGPSAQTEIEGAAIDSTGRAIFQSLEQTSAPSSGGGSEHVIHAYDATGTPVWTETIAADFALRTMTLLPDDSLGSSAWLYVTNPDEPKGNWEMRTLAPDGSLSVIEEAGTSVGPGGATITWATATGPSGEIAAAGQFAGTIDFGAGPIDGGTAEGSHAMLFVVEPHSAPPIVTSNP